MSEFRLFKEFERSVMIKDANGAWQPALAKLKWGCMFVHFRDGSNKERIVYLLGLGLGYVRFSPQAHGIEIEEPSACCPVHLKLCSNHDFIEWRDAIETYCTKWDLASKFRCESKIGRGGFGKVYQAQDIRTRKNVALKFIETKEMSDQNELDIMSKCDHPCVMEAFDVVLTESTAVVLMPFMNRGSICDLLYNHGKIPENLTRTIMRSVLQGMEYLHDRRVVHRDIKPDNIMVDYDRDRSGLELVVKIGDFGLSEVLEANEMIPAGVVSGTPGYQAPEILMLKSYDMSADVWACGVVMVEMMTGRKMFLSSSRSGYRDTALRGFVPDDFPALSVEAIDLIALLMHQDQYSRTSISKALQHPWFSNHADCSRKELRAFF